MALHGKRGLGGMHSACQQRLVLTCKSLWLKFCTAFHLFCRSLQQMHQSSDWLGVL